MFISMYDVRSLNLDVIYAVCVCNKFVFVINLRL